MQSLLDWLVTLSPATLYGVLTVVAAIENLVPPFPSDVVVAFGSFVAAQGTGTAFGVFLATWFGNVTGAMIVFALGRKYGARRIEQRLAGAHAAGWHARLQRMFRRFGLPAIFVSRFVPGVRAVVPAFAGALRQPLLPTAVMIACASAVWYGLITYVAFQVGADWPRLKGMIAQYSTTAAIVASTLLAVGIAIWLIVRQRRKS